MGRRRLPLPLDFLTARCALRFRRQGHLGRDEFPVGLIAFLGLALGVVGVRKQPVIVLLGKRVVLVIVALGAGEGGAEPDGRRGIYPVKNRLHAVLLAVGSGLYID